MGFTNRLVNVALETYPFVDEFPSAGLVATILTPPAGKLTTLKVPKTKPLVSIDCTSKSSKLLIVLSTKFEFTLVPFAKRTFAVPTLSPKILFEISNEPPSDTKTAESISASFPS